MYLFYSVTALPVVIFFFFPYFKCTITQESDDQFYFGIKEIQTHGRSLDLLKVIYLVNEPETEYKSSFIPAFYTLYSQCI